MPDDSFRAFWRSQYGDCPPIGFLMRETFPDRWFRIHSLPESKRYPETAAELATVLARHNTVVADLLGEDSPVVVVTKPYDGNVPPGKARGQRQLAALGLEHLMTVTESNPPDADDAWSIPLSSARSVWSPRALDDVLADVANHVLWPFLIVSEESGRVYAPYDGGADLFLGSSAERDEMKRRFDRWLPKHPTGL